MRRSRTPSRTRCAAFPSATKRSSRSRLISSPRSETAVTEAFHSAAAENFPPQVLVPEMHEAASLQATWAVMPRGKRRKHYYKKYTHVFDVEITPQLAESLTTFGGTTLGAVLKDQL